jgi:hypothetical protein
MTGEAGRDHLLPEGSGDLTGPGIVVPSPPGGPRRAAPSRRPGADRVLRRRSLAGAVPPGRHPCGPPERHPKSSSGQQPALAATHRLRLSTNAAAAIFQAL